MRVFRSFRRFRLSQSALVVSLLLLSGIIHASASESIRLGMVLDKGGRDDKSFNASAYRGALKVKNELKAFIKEVEATDDNAFEPMLRSLAQKKFDIIYAIGVSQADAIRKVAKQFPQQKFVIMDAEVDHLDNVRSIVFEEHEGSYLVGAMAALTSKTNAVGFIGGMDIPLIRRFEMGYAAGARKINPKIKVLSNYVGVTADSWNNPAKAKELALSQFSSGSDIIFCAAGASCSGIFDAAEEQRKFAIGVDSNQNGVKPGRILTSMVKQLDQAVFTTAKEVMEGKFKGGIVRMGLENEGVGYTLDSHNEKILPETVRKKVELIKKDIISGKIQVPDYYKNRK